MPETWPDTLAAKGILCALYPPCLVIEEPQVVMHKGYEPDFLADLLEADVLLREHLAEIDFSAADADAATRGDGDSAIVQRACQFRLSLDKVEVRGCRVRRVFHVERMMRAFEVVLVHEAIEIGLLLPCRSRMAGTVLIGSVPTNR